MRTGMSTPTDIGGGAVALAVRSHTAALRSCAPLKCSAPHDNRHHSSAPAGRCRHAPSRAVVARRPALFQCLLDHFSRGSCTAGVFSRSVRAVNG